MGLPACLTNIQTLIGSRIFAGGIHVIAFYDESRDQSLQLLKQFQRTNPNVLTIILNPAPHPTAPRVQRIAIARNGLLEHIRQYYPTVDYFIMMDTNYYSCVGVIRPHVIGSVLRETNMWDSVSFDREDGYYDYFALRYEPYVYSFFHFTNWREANKRLVNHFRGILASAKRAGAGYIPVLSAFNGFAIYKTSVFINCHYTSDINLSLYPEGSIKTHEKVVGLKTLKYLGEDCEHCAFHIEAASNGARNRISLRRVFEPTGLRLKEWNISLKPR
jgi:hypothetical protein